MPVIATNTAANSSLRYLNVNSDAESSITSKLASGSRITKASDDASGLAIGTRIQSDVTVLEQASTNASQATAILQTADGGLARISDILQRMKALATQSNSGSVTNDERTYIQSEYAELMEEIDGIASSTRYNGESLLNGTSDYFSGVDFMVGTSISDTISVQIDDVDTTALSINSTTVSDQDEAEAAVTALDAAISSISAARAEVGASMSRFDFRSQTIDTSIENLSAAESAVMDADVASEKSKLASADVLAQAAIAALTQANAMPQNLLSLLKS
ncbi:flagellin [Magnetospirillum aberrantis]|uniref:Flagellin n=1 Tax=Magnetospirillum aberrantis SpK TaxID=908842 RepID=A0A7C9QSS2_9PROT|nr:flagellin [Magnetospirillum aberrantis]NFV79665.1 flagellin [Magnetospirillum aberrantis SpK]